MSEPVERDRIARLLRQQAALASFGSYAFREQDLQKVLTEAARVCAEGLDVPFCKICRYREAEDDLLIVAGQGWHAGVVGLVVSEADETSPQGRAYTTGQPVIIRDLREANDFIFPAFYAEHAIVSTVDVLIKGVTGDSLRRARDRQPGAADLRRARRGLPDRLRQRAGRGGGDRRTQRPAARTIGRWRWSPARRTSCWPNATSWPRS